MCEINSQAIQDVTDRNSLFSAEIQKNRILKVNGQNYNYFQSRKISGKIKTITIKRDSLGDFYIFVVTDAENVKVETRTGKRVGFDFGLKNFLTSSDGKIISSPLFFAQNAKQIAKACKNLSHKQKGSNNRRRAKIALARIYKKSVNQRKDFQFNLARKLCLEYEKNFIEDLNIKAMQKLWGKKISDLAFYKFVQILKYQAEKFGVEVSEVDRYFASSQICSQCGEKNILKNGLGHRPMQEIE